MMEVVLKVDGMACDACVRHVTNAISAIPGVESAQVSLSKGNAVVSYNSAVVAVPQIVEAIQEEGYEAS